MNVCSNLATTHKDSLVLFFILTLVLTWVYQHTSDSMLITGQNHYVVNISASILGLTLTVWGVVMLAASVLVITPDKEMSWFGKENEWTRASQLPLIPPA